MTQQSLPYYQAARFPNKKEAGTVYDAVQALIYADIDCDLSAYRFKLNTTWHVVVIGEKPSDKLHVDIEAQLTNGTLVTLDSNVLYELLARRVEAIQLGPWVEGHYSEDD
jgi:hypothetical protein